MKHLISGLFSGEGCAQGRVARGPRLRPIGADDTARRVELLDSFEQAGLGWFWASDAEGRIIYLSPEALASIGATSEEVLGLPITELFELAGDAGEKGGERTINFLLRARNSISKLTVKVPSTKGETRWEIAGKPKFTTDGKFAGYRGSARDVTESLEQQRDAERASRCDTLTGLANREHMAGKLARTLSAFRNAKRSCALLMLDLDRFKQVNDTHGHPVGDELLKQAAARIKRIIGDRGEIARLGGDEFQVMVPDADDRGVLGDLGQRIVQMLSQPYTVDGNRAIIGASVGIAIAPYDGVEADELVNAADMALHAAKASGRGRYRFYASDMKQQAKRAALIEAELRDAISRGELEVHYQPIVDAKTHKVKCVEALMRWQHADYGWISPAEFIPIAEEVGLIRDLGAWALQSACEEANGWPVPLRVAINVSAIQFEREDFPRIVERALQRSGIDPARIELEITESVFVGDYGRAKGIFDQLKKLGVRLALDDFGTGYSSLSYLRDAPFDKIKIDQSFVRGCSEKGNSNAAIIGAITGLAKALEMETVAEGIETKDELALVTARGAASLQGMLFSTAVTGEELAERLASGELVYEPKGPDKFRASRRSEFRRIGLVHENHRYVVILRNLSRTGAMVEGLLDVPIGTQVVLDLGSGQLAVATVRRSEGYTQGVEFETELISDGADGLCTRHRVSPYQIEAAGRALSALSDDAYAVLAAQGGVQASAPRFKLIDPSRIRPHAA